VVANDRRAGPPVGVTARGPVRIAGAAALITVLTVVARIAGFGRTFVFLHTVGDTRLGDLYNSANTIPNIVFELVAGGALAGLVVPLLAAHVAVGDTGRVGAVASALLTWVLTLLVPLAVVVALAAGPIATLLGIPAEHHDVAVRLLRVFAPQLPLYGVGIVLTGVLQAHHRFAWPVIAPLLSSVTVMTAYLGYAAADGVRTSFAGLTRGGELFLSAGTTAGVVVLALCLLIPLRRLRLRLRPAYRFPGGEGREAVRLGWAGAVTVGSQQVMTFVVILQTADAGYTRYVAAQTVFLLPWAVLAVPVATAVYPVLAANRDDPVAYRSALSAAARSVLLLACLGAAALAALAVPIAVVLNAREAAAPIAGFAPGLLGYALFALLSRALYARGATVAAAAATAAGWGVAIVAALVLHAVRDDVFGLALAAAIGMTTTGVLLVVAVRRSAGPEALAGLGRVLGVGIVAAGIAALAGWEATRVPGGALVQAVAGGITVLVVFAGVAYALDRRDLQPMVRRLRGGGQG
jgi:putative peptidoglycan lipid II flippase